MHKKNCVSFKSATHGTKSSNTYTKSIDRTQKHFGKGLQEYFNKICILLKLGLDFGSTLNWFFKKKIMTLQVYDIKISSDAPSIRM